MRDSIAVGLILVYRIIQRLLQGVVVGVIALHNSSLVSLSSWMSRIIEGISHVSMRSRIVVSSLLRFSNVGRRIGRLTVLGLVCLDGHLVVVVRRGAVLVNRIAKARSIKFFACSIN
jgi:hypothetical protein